MFVLNGKGIRAEDKNRFTKGFANVLSWCAKYFKASLVWEAPRGGRFAY